MSLQQIQALPEQRRALLFVELERLYADLERALQQIPRPCDACGRCCHFREAEHRLYGSSLELAYMLEKAQPVPRTTEDRCPHQNNGLCGARDERLIGCRTFYRMHLEEDREKAEALYEKMLGEVKKIYQREHLNWEYRDLMSVYR